MSWSDDTRCLFCDGKLPLFRKLAQGQFCSKVHQEAYWKEQEQLAVQVLHRTHETLQAYKPATSIESILGPTPAPAESDPRPSLETVPDLQWLQVQYAGDPIAPPISAIIAADPVEYEPHPRASKPSREIENTPLRGLEALAGLLALNNTHSRVPEPVTMPASLAIIDAQLTVTSPEWSPAATPGFPMRGRLAMPEIQAGGELAFAGHQEPAAFEIQPMRAMSHTLAPQGDLIERLEREAFPLGETLLAIAGPAVVETSAAVLDTSEPEAFPGTAVERPLAQDVVWQAQGLSEQRGLLAIGSIVARNSNTGIAGEINALEPRTPVVAMDQVRLQLAGADPIVDLLQHSGCAPLAPQPMFTAYGGVEPTANRPVSFQASAPEFTLVLPETRLQGAVSFEIRFHAQRVLPLDLVDKIVPRGDIRLRGVFPAMPLPGETLLPASKLQPVKAKPVPLSATAGVLAEESAKQEQSVRGMAAGVANFWHQAPRDLKMLLFAVPVALGLAFHPSLPKVSVAAPQADTQAVTGRFQEVLDTQMANLRKSMAERAAVGLDENFRQGLDNWMSHSGSTAEWSFDQAGFVQPGRVALYQPSLGLTDYEFQFLGAIDKGALSWVTRAVDFQNYYVVKLAVVKPGPVPEMGITRYAVINGKPMDRVDTPVTFSARTDSLYRVSQVMEGDHYSLVIQGQMIDSWKEPRLKRGGVGFFTNQGEQSRIGWVQITHQYDMLGRLFAYLAP
jgi:hypothetical protein